MFSLLSADGVGMSTSSEIGSCNLSAKLYVPTQKKSTEENWNYPLSSPFPSVRFSNLENLENLEIFRLTVPRDEEDSKSLIERWLSRAENQIYLHFAILPLTF